MIGLYKPCINLPFGDCAIYFDHGVVVLIVVVVVVAVAVAVAA